MLSLRDCINSPEIVISCQDMSQNNITCHFPTVQTSIGIFAELMSLRLCQLLYKINQLLIHNLFYMSAKEQRIFGFICAVNWEIALSHLKLQLTSVFGVLCKRVKDTSLNHLSNLNISYKKPNGL